MFKFLVSAAALIFPMLSWSGSVAAYSVRTEMQPIAASEIAPHIRATLEREFPIGSATVKLTHTRLLITLDLNRMEDPKLILDVVRLGMPSQCDAVERCTMLVFNYKGDVIARLQAFNGLISNSAGLSGGRMGTSIIFEQGCADRNPLIEFSDPEQARTSKEVQCPPHEIVMPSPSRFKFLGRKLNDQ
ncbi:MAG: hypothetical protein ABL904_07685 [Hyphomicrobiaceae bacterium]